MNTGLYEGDEIVQVYVRDVQASIVRPVKELKGFSRVTLASGETKHVTFDMPTDVLSFVTDGKRIVEPGVFDVMIGSSSQDILWSGQFTLSGATRVLDRHWRCRTSVTVDS
jgi:beta-glucosidase